MDVLDPDGRVASIAPDLVAALRELDEAARAAMGKSELDLCRIRLAQVLGDEPASQRLMRHSALEPEKLHALDEWWVAGCFSDYERAVLGFTEQFAFSVSAVTQADIDALLAHRPVAEVYDLVMGLYVLDQALRADIVLGAVLGAKGPTTSAGEA